MVLEKRINSKVASIIYVVIAIAILLLAVASAQIVSNLINEVFATNPALDDVIYSIIYIFMALLLGSIYAKYMLHLSPQDIGVTRCFPGVKWVIIGVLLPVIILTFYLVFIDGKLIRNDMLNFEGVKSTVITAIFVKGISAGIVEEFIFRGLIMHIVEKAWGRKVAIIVPAFLFGALHLTNMSEWAVGDAILLIIAGTAVGVMFSLIAYQSNNIWASAIVHAIWNIIIIGNILEICSSNSGMGINSIYYYKLNGSNLLLTGGRYGIEIAFPAILGYLLVSIIAVLGKKRNNRKSVY